MSDIYTIYSKQSCTFCQRAKELLDTHSIPYQIVDITNDANTRVYLKSQGFHTVPQIFKGAEYIGGYTELQDYLIENDPRFSV